MHDMVHPRVCKFTKRFHILWSRDGTLDSSSRFTPNHFVPLLKLSNKKEKRDRLKTSTLITNPISVEHDDKNDDDNDEWNHEDDELVEISESLVRICLSFVNNYYENLQT